MGKWSVVSNPQANPPSLVSLLTTQWTPDVNDTSGISWIFQVQNQIDITNAASITDYKTLMQNAFTAQKIIATGIIAMNAGQFH